MPKVYRPATKNLGGATTAALGLSTGSPPISQWQSGRLQCWPYATRWASLPRVECRGEVIHQGGLLARHTRSGASVSRAVSNRSRDLFKQKLEFTTVDPVAFHDKPDQGIVYQFSEHTLSDVQDVSPQLF